MSGKGLNLGLSSYDDLFETDQSREELALPKIRDVPISEIDDFPDHPYKVLEDDDMEQLVESIKERGVITPATLRQKEDGRYEMVSGHRRKRACELAGLSTLKAEVQELTKDEAIILMVDSNLQRSTILPSEKAFAYKLRLEAMKRQGERTDLTSAPVGRKFEGKESVEIIGESTGESRNTIRRYIRLTELLPPILELVDTKKVAFRPAVELSYLAPTEQQCLMDAIEFHDATPSLAQAIKMRQFSKENKLSDTVIDSIMQEEKPNQRQGYPFKSERISKLIPTSVPREKAEDFVVKALEHYTRYLKRNDKER